MVGVDDDQLPISYNYNAERNDVSSSSRIVNQSADSRGGGKGKGSVYKTRVRSRKATGAFNNTVLPPSLCDPCLHWAEVGKVREKGCGWNEVVMSSDRP
jgi:hypothetical protein